MEFEHAAIALLASMVLVLAGMVGWIYWQQTRMFQNMNNIVMVVGELAASREADPEPIAEEHVLEEPVAEEPVAEEPEDDRVSVDAEPIQITGPPAEDTDGLEDKSKKDLQALLVKRGIPFGKADNKNALISLLKATS